MRHYRLKQDHIICLCSHLLITVAKTGYVYGVAAALVYQPPAANGRMQEVTVVTEMVELSGKSEASKATDKRVVLIEYEKSPLLPVREALKSKGYQFSCCAGGFDALDEISSQGADLVIVAANLSDLSGYQLCCLIKSSESCRHLPVIVINTSAEEAEPFWSLAAQPDYVFSARDLKDDGQKLLTALPEIMKNAEQAGWDAQKAKDKAIVAGSYSSANLLSSYNNLLGELVVERLIGRITRQLVNVIEPRKRFMDTYYAEVSRLFACPLYGLVLASSSDPWGAFRIGEEYSRKSFTDMVRKLSAQLDIHKDIVLDVRGDLREDGGHDAPEPLVLPVKDERGTLGALIFANQAKSEWDSLSKKAMAQLQLDMLPVLRLLIANQEIQSLNQKEQYRVSTDSLTGLYNLEFLVGFLQQQLLFSYRQKSPVGVAVIDIDHLKRINDEYGYEIGDLVLSTIGNRLLNQTRGSDLIGRYGGDELAVILPNTDLNGTRVVAEKIRLEIEQMSFVKGTARKGPRVTVSVGCAVFNMEDLNPETIITDAKQALKQAKAQGGNRVALWEG